MTGYQSKKLMSAERHADPVTIDHIIELRKQIAKLEDTVRERDRQIQNALDVVMEYKAKLAFYRT
jgi:hypothetical protein